MDSTVPILEYGKQPRRRRWRVVFVGLCVLFLAVAGVLGWQQRRAIRAYAENQYADWQFARAFDRAERELMGDGDTWLAAGDPQQPDKRAEQQLDRLMAMCSPPSALGLPPISREEGTCVDRSPPLAGVCLHSERQSVGLDLRTQKPRRPRGRPAFHGTPMGKRCRTALRLSIAGHQESGK